jgi:hypothetical protein
VAPLSTVVRMAWERAGNAGPFPLHQARFDQLEEPEYFTRATKARQWHEAILGRELAKGETADPVSLRGTLVMLDAGECGSREAARARDDLP